MPRTIVITTYDTAGVATGTQTITVQTSPSQDNSDTLQAAAVTALANNRTFQAVAAPTNAQIIAQTKALTRQNNALIRLLLGLLDGTD